MSSMSPITTLFVSACAAGANAQSAHAIAYNFLALLIYRVLVELLLRSTEINAASGIDRWRKPSRLFSSRFWRLRRAGVRLRRYKSENNMPLLLFKARTRVSPIISGNVTLVVLHNSERRGRRDRLGNYREAIRRPAIVTRLAAFKD